MHSCPDNLKDTMFCAPTGLAAGGITILQLPIVHEGKPAIGERCTEGDANITLPTTAVDHR